MAEEIAFGPVTIRWRLEGDASNGSVSIFEFDIAAEGKVPLAHSHDGYEETIYGLSGTLTWTVEGEVTENGPGDVLCIPRGAVHRFDNLSGEPTSSLAIVTPGVLGPAFFREMRDVIAGAGGPPDPAAVGAVMRRHGLTPQP
jgi:quercetin dioxygenase-like cupin family protein